MLGDKTLLGGTLMVTFLSGSFVGYTAHEMRGTPAGSPYDATTVYAQELTELEGRGYDDEALTQATDIYQDYMSAYAGWWNQFCNTYAENLDALDEKLEKRLGELEASTAGRLGDVLQPPPPLTVPRGGPEKRENGD